MRAYLGKTKAVVSLIFLEFFEYKEFYLQLVHEYDGSFYCEERYW
ncbi:MAG: hypothetical protein ACJAS4_003924 [Bacteriovoracaceae bacterium]|jgi:hypothetical protein